MAESPTTVPEVTGVDAYRIEQFEEMGFTTKEAQKLAGARDEVGFPVYPGKVKKMIAAGCGHVLAIEIFT